MKQDLLEERVIRKMLGDLFQIDSLTHEIWGATCEMLFFSPRKAFGSKTN